MNIVDIDIYMRVFNCMFGTCTSCSDIAKIPGTALYDFCNAFPTVLHEWLFFMLRCYKLPHSFRCLIRSLYSKISALSSGIGDGTWLLDVLGGVKTGCPLRPLLFLLYIKPFCVFV